MSDDLISRQAAIDAVDSETVSTNPEHFKSSEKFIEFMDDTDIASFGKWQWANGFNTALVATTVQLKNLPSAERRGRWIKKYRGNYLCSVCGAWYRTTDDYGNIIDGEMTANYCESCGAKMDEVETNETCTSRRSE